MRGVWQFLTLPLGIWQHVPSSHFTEWNPKKRGNNNRMKLATLPSVDAIEPQTNPSSENPLKWMETTGQHPSSAHCNRAGCTGCDSLYMYWANATDLFKRPRYWFVYFTYLSYFSSLPSVTSADLLTSVCLNTHKDTKQRKVVRQVALCEYTESGLCSFN